MRKLINKLLLVIVLVFIGNMIPSEASANTYSMNAVDRAGNPYVLYVSMFPNALSSSESERVGQSSPLGVSLGVGDYKKVYKSTHTTLEGTTTDSDAQTNFNSMDAQIFYNGLPESNIINYDIPLYNYTTFSSPTPVQYYQTYYPDGVQSDPVYNSIIGTGRLMKFNLGVTHYDPNDHNNFVNPTDGTTNYALHINYTVSNVLHTMDIPIFTIYPHVEIHAYDLTTGTSVLIPSTVSQQQSFTTTQAITRGTPIRLHWRAYGYNPGFNCTMPNGALSGVNREQGDYPSPTTTIPANENSGSVYYTQIICTEAPYVVVTTSKLSNVSMSGVTVGVDVGTLRGTTLTEVGVDWSNALDFSSGTRVPITTSPTGINTTYSINITSLSNTNLGSSSGYPACWPNSTAYYIRGYAKRSSGTTYGNTRKVILKGDSLCSSI